MGKIKQGILGGFSGKVANIIGGSWKGIAYMRSQPLSVANPKTAGQVAQRTAFSFAVMIAQLVLATIIKPTWDRFAQQMSGYNAFIKANVGVMVDFATTEWVNVKMSLGKMVATPITGFVAVVESADVALSWNPALVGQLQLANDKVYVTVVNETTEIVKGFITAATRADGTVTITMPAQFNGGNELHAYLTFLRNDGSVVSDSYYSNLVVA